METFTLPDGSPWPAPWTTAKLPTGAVAAVAAGEGVLTTAATTGNYADTDAVAARRDTQTIDLDVTFTIRLVTSGVFPRFVLRSDNANLDPQNGVVVDLAGTVGVREVSGWSYSTIGTGTGAWSVGVDYRVRVSAQGAAVKVKQWPSAGTEPAGWEIETTTSITSIGHYGFWVAPGGPAAAYTTTFDNITDNTEASTFALTATGPGFKKMAEFLGTMTSEPFTPPAGSLIVCLSAFDANNVNRTATVTTDTGATSMWTRVRRQPGNGLAEIDWSTSLTSTPTVIRCTWNGSSDASLTGLVFTGADPINPVGAGGERKATATTTVNWTPTRVGSRAVVCYSCYSATKQPASAQLTKIGGSSKNSGMAVFVSDPSTAGTNTFTLTNCTANATIAWAEVVPWDGVDRDQPHTGGTGGVTVDTFNILFTASNGYSSQYHVWATGVDLTNPGVLIQYHGDEAFEFKNPQSTWCFAGPNGLVAKAKARGMLTVACLTPDIIPEETWWEDGPENGVYGHDLIRQEIFQKYNIDRGNVWLVGYSGGSQFITERYLPTYSSDILGGGAVIMGGGAKPRSVFQPATQAMLDGYNLFWYTGADDTGPAYNALADAQEGSSWYAANGWQRVTLDAPAGINHDNILFGTVVGERMALVDAPTATRLFTGWGIPA